MMGIRIFQACLVGCLAVAITARADMVWDFNTALPPGETLPDGWSQFSKDGFAGGNPENEAFEDISWRVDQGKLTLDYPQNDPKFFGTYLQSPTFRFVTKPSSIQIQLSAAFDRDDEFYMTFAHPFATENTGANDAFFDFDDYVDLDDRDPQVDLVGFDADFVTEIGDAPVGVFTLRIGAGDYDLTKSYSHVAINEITIIGAEPALLGDIDLDDDLDGQDVDRLSRAIRANERPAAFDLNGDGVLDVADREVWVEKLKRTIPGDSNLDRRFDSDDLVSVFQAGQYEDDIAGNGAWEAGDWNGDADFNSADLVSAFNRGAYEVGPQPAIPIPEPSTLLMLSVATLASARRVIRR